MVASKIPMLVAHRGWPARYPENTLEGFAAAAVAGARWLECDVQLSADAVPFVCHDLSLKRTGELDRLVTEMTAAELRKVCVGEPQRFNARYAQVRLPALANLIAWLATRPDVTLFVEIKRQSLRHHGAGLAVEKVMQAVRPAQNRCVIISFDPACVALAREQGAAAIGWAVEDTAPATRQSARALSPDYLFTSEALFATVHAALPGAWRWVVYQTQDPARAVALAAQGAGLVETNDIGAMLGDPRLRSA